MAPILYQLMGNYQTLYHASDLSKHYLSYLHKYFSNGTNPLDPRLDNPIELLVVLSLILGLSISAIYLEKKINKKTKDDDDDDIPYF